MERKFYIGGHDAAAIIGVHPFLTTIDVWRQKVLNQKKELTEEEIKLFTRGADLEKLLAPLISYELKLTDIKTNLFKTNGKFNFLAGTADIFDEKNKILVEIKTSRKNTLQDYYVAQICHYAHIFLPRKIFIAIYTENYATINPKNFNLNIYEFSFEELEQDVNYILEECVKFYNEYIITKKEPPLIHKGF